MIKSRHSLPIHNFGPFPDGTAARETFKLLNRLYPLRKCNHIPKKPCLYYSLNQCVAPCIQEVSDEVYKEMTSSITFSQWIEPI